MSQPLSGAANKLLHMRPDPDDFEEVEGSRYSFEPPRPSSGPQRRKSDRGPEQKLRAEDSAGSLLIGPMSAGKTCLLLAIRQACMLRRQGEPQLHFVPESKEMADLIFKSLQVFLEDRGLPGTPGTTHYRFSIHEEPQVRLFHRFSKRKSVRMTILDGPGGALFTSEEKANQTKRRDIDKFRDHLIEFGRERARSLILCVDASKPHPAFLESHLPRLISEMCVPETKGKSWSQKMSSWLRREHHAPSWQYLRFDRVLVLLTKIDLVCSAVAKRHQAHHQDCLFRTSPMRGNFAPMTPARLASLIDPIQQARVLLGDTILPGLQAAMKPGATLAVGVSSAGGFLPGTGEAFLNARREQPVTNDENLNNWQPFGVREALRFLATGQEASSIKIVSGRDLLIGNEVPCLSLSCGSNGPGHETVSNRRALDET